MRYRFLIDTYDSERVKVLSMWTCAGLAARLPLSLALLATVAGCGDDALPTPADLAMAIVIDQSVPAPDLAPEIGCSDGTREGYVDAVKYPTIAACAGTWAPQSLRASGTGKPCGQNNLCTVPADACADGWHICMTNGWPRDLSSRTSSDDCSSVIAGGGFFLTAADHAISECAGPCQYGPLPLPCTDHAPVACGLGSLVNDYCCPDQVWPKATPATDMPVGTIACNNLDTKKSGRHGGLTLGVLCCKDPAVDGM